MHLQKTINPKPIMNAQLLRHARKMGSVLGKLFSTCISDIRSNVQHVHGTPDEPPMKAETIISAIIDSIPRALPLVPCVELQETIAVLSVHPNIYANIRPAAFEAARRLFRAWPPIRSSMIGCYCEMVIQTLESSESVIIDAIDRLCDLIDELKTGRVMKSKGLTLSMWKVSHFTCYAVSMHQCGPLG
eukprot:SAG31_NODE_11450_length_1028_cov_1.711518_2_plen_188_part_00